MNSIKANLLISAFFILPCVLTSCGGGGGGGSSSETAKLDLRVDPEVLDSGDVTNLTVEISEIKESIWTLKIRFPVGLAYVDYSSFYVVDDNTISTAPEHKGSDKTYSYLVYYPTRNIFEPRGHGKLLLRLKARENVPDGLIGVDSDVYASGFNPSNPRFDPQDEENIRVGPEPPKSSSSAK